MGQVRDIWLCRNLFEKEVRIQETGDRIQNKVLAFGSVKRILFRYDGAWLFSRRLNKNIGAKRHRILLSPVFCILISLVHSLL